MLLIVAGRAGDESCHAESATCTVGGGHDERRGVIGRIDAYLRRCGLARSSHSRSTSAEDGAGTGAGGERDRGAFGALTSGWLSDLLPIGVNERNTRESAEVTCSVAGIRQDQHGVALARPGLGIAQPSLELRRCAVGTRRGVAHGRRRRRSSSGLRRGT